MRVLMILFCSLVSMTVLQSQSFRKEISQGEYFFGTDPGEGNGTAITISPDVLVSFSETVPTVGLPLGPNLLSVRVMGNDGAWSRPFQTVVYVEGAFNASRTVRITQAEYFFDTDPGEGNASALTVKDGNFDEALEEAFQYGIPALDTGAHVLNVRALGEDDVWSRPFQTVVSIQDRRTAPVFDRLLITEMEYFFDLDPGEGSGIPLLVSDGKWDEALEMAEADVFTGSLDLGNHVLNVRSKDRSGAWSRPFQTVINIQPSLSVIPIAGQITGNDNFCNGEATFGVQYTTEVITGNTYTWSLVGGTILQETASGSAIVVSWDVNAPEHEVRLLTCEGANCADTVSTVVVIGTEPDFEILASENFLCEGEEITLSVDGINGEVTYCWRQEGFDVNNLTSSLDIFVEGEYSVLLNQDGCEAERTITIESRQSPAAYVAVLGNVEFCEDGTTRLLAPESEIVNYRWLRDGVIIPNETSTELIVSEVGNYTLEAMNMNCETSSEPVPVVVIPLGNATVSSNTGAFSLCSGEMITLSVEETPEVSYQWFNNEIAINNQTSNALAVNMEGSYSIQFINDRCERFSDLAEVISIETPNPVIESEGFLFFCDNDSVRLFSTVEEGVVYQWTLDGADLVDESDPVNFFAMEAGDYQVEANRNGCIALSNTLAALVQPSPEIPLITSEQFGELIASEANSYQWFMNGQELTGETDRILLINEQGDYTVRIGDQNNFCFSISDDFFAGFTIVGLVDEQEVDQFVVFPSISDGMIHFETEVDQVKIYSMKGELVYETTNSVSDLNISQLTNGTYQIKTNKGMGRFIRK